MVANKNYYAIIMSGGVGKRFWPASTLDNPKQFLPIVGNEPIIKQTYSRLKKFFLPQNIFICTGKKWQDKIQHLFSGEKVNFILEPFAHDTLNAFLLAVARIKQIDPDGIIGIFPCDHFISPEEEFIKFLNKSYQYLEDERQGFVLGGIKPHYPSTLYGYIETSPAHQGEEIEKVISFREKPSEEVAREYLSHGNFYWNSGMLLTTVEYFYQECNNLEPEYLENIENYLKTQKTFFYRNNPKISFDYAILEKSRHLYLFPLYFYWNDIGSWEAALEIYQKFNLPILKQTPFYDEKRRSWIISDLPLEDIKVVEITDSLLILYQGKVLLSRLGRSHYVKDLL